MVTDSWALPEHTRAATAARMYDYFLGGTNNFPADREAAEQVIALNPHTCDAALAARAFLARIVRDLVGRGIRQFLDVGSGIPTVGNVHEIAQQAASEARIVYVDIDPVAVFHSRQILRGNELAAAIPGDLLRPDELLGQPEVRRLIDFTQPVGLLLLGVLHFCDDTAYDAVARLREQLTTDSYLALSHITPEESVAHVADAGMGVYRRATATPMRMRTPEEILRFAGDFTLLRPGLVPVDQWHNPGHQPDPAVALVLGGLTHRT